MNIPKSVRIMAVASVTIVVICVIAFISIIVLDRLTSNENKNSIQSDESLKKTALNAENQQNYDLAIRTYSKLRDRYKTSGDEGKLLDMEAKIGQLQRSKADEKKLEDQSAKDEKQRALDAGAADIK